ncbi:MAG: substrate-binding domain-containing protein [Actinobacteria bacterium]|nr:substrate-binding domain-containing protein [Actinomycetota bacterium]
MKHRVVFAGLGALAIVVSACGGSSGGGKVALLLPEKQTARYEAADRPFFEAKLKELCPDQFKEYIYNNAAEDATAQQQQAEAAITAGAKVLVLDPVDGEAAGKIVTDAAAKGVKVISYDRLLKGGSKPDYYISFDNEAVGRLQGQALLDKLTADGKTMAKVIWINGSPKDNNALLFAKGAHSVLDGKVEILKEDAMANWKQEEAQQIMEAAIAEFGKDGFDAVYVANDGGAAGVYAAMVANGVDPKTKPITGQDAQVDAIQRILTGDQYMTVYKAIQPEAELAAQLACKLVKGEKITDTTVAVNNGTIDVPSLLLTPVAVTVDGAVAGTKSVKDTVVADSFYGADTVAKICTPDFAAACTKAGIQ